MATEKLRELRLHHQIPAKDMVSVVQDLYPKYDKTMQSKCERGGEYGIQLRPDAMSALLSKFAPGWKSKRSGGHRLSCRISCRLEEGVYAQLQLLVKADGYDTMQDWLADLIKALVRQQNESKSEGQGGFTMEKSIVGVKYKNRDTGSFEGRTYNYFSELPVQVGDIVSAPTAKGESIAQITEVNVPESKIDDRILPLLKTITAFAEETEG